MINDAVCDELIVEWQASCGAVLFVTVSCELQGSAACAAVESTVAHNRPVSEYNTSAS